MAISIEEGLSYSYGCYNKVELVDNKLELAGWMLSPDSPFDEFLLFIDNKFISKLTLTENAGVAEKFILQPYALKSAFDEKVEVDIATDGLFNICIVGAFNGKQLAKIETCHSSKADKEIKERAPHLMKRVTGIDQFEYFRAISFRSFGDYWRLINKHHSDKKIARLLDWGCGCARITTMIKDLTDIPEIHGCDIDEEAINYCSDNFQGIDFNVIPLNPPTSYQDEHFDVIISNSVLTHLTEETQIAWLCEMKRILKPQGLLIASVHGEHATYLCFPDEHMKLMRRGIYDTIRGDLLKGIAPDDYYRETFQSRKYTMETYSKYFDVLEYVEQGSLAYQDIVVMKKVDSDLSIKKQSLGEKFNRLLKRY